MGVLNAAVWVGAAFLFVFGIDPAARSPELRDLIGPANFPYFSVAIGQLLVTRYFHLFLACASLALLHLAAEWLYLGKYPKRAWLGFLLALWLFGLFQNYWLQPNLKAWHYAQYAKPPQSERAARAFRAGHAASQAADFLALCSLAFYLWRVANPPDPARFVSTSKFRG